MCVCVCACMHACMYENTTKEMGNFTRMKEFIQVNVCSCVSTSNMIRHSSMWPMQWYALACVHLLTGHQCVCQLWDPVLVLHCLA